MPANGTVTINRRQLIAEISVAEPVMKRVTDKVMKEAFFDPAVKQLKEDFEDNPVTREIAGGIGADNESGTLEGEFRQDPDKLDGKPNLFSFIGFETEDQPLVEIEKRLDPSHIDGPKMVYKGMDKSNLTFRYEIRAPNEEAIYDHTPMPWSPGLSWAKRIEQGIPGIGYFLNALNRKGSRSGGGIQIQNQLRTGRFKPVSYLSQIFNNFLRRVVGRADNGRKI